MQYKVYPLFFLTVKARLDVFGFRVEFAAIDDAWRGHEETPSTPSLKTTRENI